MPFLLVPMASDETSDADPLLGQTLLGRYTVIRVLGEGGMGKVYLAQQRMGQASRDVAIKTLHPELFRDPQLVARFHRECETVIGLSHPNTVQFFDFGELEDHTLFIVMEYIQGESLAHALERGPMPPDRVDKLLIQICGSLHEAHQRGVVHRDLKPENVLLTDRGGTPDFVKVLDFGIAKRSEAEDDDSAKLTKQGMVLGTPPYMSPEQFSGQTLDARSDIYSLGVMTYEMLIGRLPFDGRTPWEWATKHLTEQPAPLETFPTGSMLAPGKRMAVMRALEKDREQRQPDVVTYLREFTGFDDPAAAWTMATSVGGYPPSVAGPAPATGSAGAAPRPPVGTPSAPMPESGSHGAAPVPGGAWPSAGAPASGSVWGTPPHPSADTGPTTVPGLARSGTRLGRWLAVGGVALLLMAGLGAGATAWLLRQGSPGPEDTLVDGEPTTGAGVVLGGRGPAAAEGADRRPDAPTPKPGAGTPARGDLPTGVMAPTRDDDDTDDGDRRPGANGSSTDGARNDGARAAPGDRPADEQQQQQQEEEEDDDGGESNGSSRLARARALAARGASALERNDLEGAASALLGAQRAGGRRAAPVRDLRNDLGRTASRRIGILLQQGKCPDAQRLYRRVARAGAGGPSQVHFSDWCPRP